MRNIIFFVEGNILCIPIKSIPIKLNIEELSFYPRLRGYSSSKFYSSEHSPIPPLPRLSGSTPGGGLRERERDNEREREREKKVKIWHKDKRFLL